MQLAAFSQTQPCRPRGEPRLYSYGPAPEAEAIGEFFPKQRKSSYAHLPSIRCATEYRLTTATFHLVVAFRAYSGTLPIPPRT